jgi:hypothetical protein
MQWPELVGRQADVRHQHLKGIVPITQEQWFRPTLTARGVEQAFAVRSVPATGIEALQQHAGAQLLGMISLRWHDYALHRPLSRDAHRRCQAE